MKTAKEWRGSLGRFTDESLEDVAMAIQDDVIDSVAEWIEFQEGTYMRDSFLEEFKVRRGKPQ